MQAKYFFAYGTLRPDGEFPHTRVCCCARKEGTLPTHTQRRTCCSALHSAFDCSPARIRSVPTVVASRMATGPAGDGAWTGSFNEGMIAHRATLCGASLHAEAYAAVVLGGSGKVRRASKSRAEALAMFA